MYGKNKCKISWPLFLYFIKQEEQDYRTDIYNKETELTVKYRKIKKFKKIKSYKKKIDSKIDQNELELSNKNKIYINIDKNIWFKWKKTHVDMIVFL